MSKDPYDLARFVGAQAHRYARVLDELAAGEKTSHWMWFIFPQVAGLGSSATARHYAIGSLQEARAYLEHPVLGPRLRQCTQLVNGIEGRSIEEIFGYPDHLKFRSCVTLFARAVDEPAAAGVAEAARNARAAGEAQPFREALEKYFAGEGDPLTLGRLTSGSGT